MRRGQIISFSLLMMFLCEVTTDVHATNKQPLDEQFNREVYNNAPSHDSPLNLANMPNAVLGNIVKKNLADKEFVNLYSVNKNLYQKIQPEKKNEKAEIIQKNGHFRKIYEKRQRKKKIHNLTFKLSELMSDESINIFTHPNEYRKMLLELVKIEAINKFFGFITDWHYCQLFNSATELEAGYKLHILLINKIEKMSGFDWIKTSPLLNLAQKYAKGTEEFPQDYKAALGLLKILGEVYKYNLIAQHILMKGEKSKIATDFMGKVRDFK